jgi:hypothetical protein
MVLTMKSGSSAAPFRTLMLLVAVLSTALLATGCSATQTIAIDASGSGTVEMDIVLDEVFAAYLTDLYASFGADDDVSLFDTEAITASINAQPGLELTGIESPNARELSLDVAFASIDALIRYQGQPVEPFIRFERTENFRRLSATVNRLAVDHMTRIAGIDPLIRESMLPPDDAMTSSEYRDYLAWALEEYTQERSLDAVFRDSVIRTTVIPAGDLVSMSGGETRNGRVSYETPLVTAVTQRGGLRYSLVFAPQ